MKKLLFNLGSMVAVVAPVAAVVSCGGKTIELDLREFKDNPTKATEKIQELFASLEKLKDEKEVTFKVTNLKGETKSFTIEKGKDSANAKAMSGMAKFLQ